MNPAAVKVKGAWKSDALTCRILFSGDTSPVNAKIVI